MALAEALAHGLPVSARGRAPFRTPCRPRRAFWCRRATSLRCRRVAVACWTMAAFGPAWPAARASPARLADLGVECGALRRSPSTPPRARRCHDRLQRRLAGAARALRSGGAASGGVRLRPAGAGRAAAGRQAGARGGRPGLRHRGEPARTGPGCAGPSAGCWSTTTRYCWRPCRQRWRPGRRCRVSRCAAPGMAGASTDRIGRPSCGCSGSTSRANWRCCRDKAALVTGAALLDLVSAAWLDELLTRAGAARSALLFALTVDGRVDWTPALAGDAPAAHLFQAHQRRDKGFGAALGGTAAGLAAERWAASGYDLIQCRSDWQIDGGEGPAARAMLSAMVAGTAAAALEQAPAAGAALDRWTGATPGLGRADPIEGRPPGPAGDAERRLDHGRGAQVQIPQHVGAHSEQASRGRRQSRIAALRGNCSPGRPPPMITGAMLRCSRSRQPCAMKRDTVTPPPSTNSTPSPRSCNAACSARRSALPSGRSRPGTPSTWSAHAPRRFGRAAGFAGQQGGDLAVAEHAQRRRQSQRRVEQHAHRVRAATRRVVSCGLSMAAVPAPTITASHSARRRCRCTSISGPLT